MNPCFAILPALVLLAFPFLEVSAQEGPKTEAKGRAEHVVIMVWDGMRPDFVSEEHTPTLARLAREGVTFTRNHSVYPTSTEVNGAALATGCWPERSGIIANREFRPAINPLRNVATEVPEVVRKGDAVMSGKYVAVPTLPELVRAAGGTTAVAATKGIGLLWDRAERPADAPFVTVAHGFTVPPTAQARLDEALGGPFPPDPPQFPNVLQDNWTARALTEVLWKDGVPTLSVLWSSDPDYSQHASAPGAPTALAALRENADANLARVLAALEAKGVRDKTNVIIVADHGFSTITESIDAVDLLKKAGFNIRPALTAPLANGEIFYIGLGGTMSFYVGGRDAEVTRRLVDFLQRSAFAGVIFTRGEAPAPGTFPLSAAHLNTPDAPDVMVALRWTDAKNVHGVPGAIAGDINRSAGRGTHATFSRFDVHNTMIAAGPDFKVGLRSETPSGNLDVAPTVAFLLGLKPPGKMDGRVLTEALRDGSGGGAPPPVSGPQVQTMRLRGEAAAAKEPEDAAAGGVNWKQYLKTVTVGGVEYLTEGNGGGKPGE